MNVVTLGVEHFIDPTKGKPIALGFVYIGEPDTDPTVVANQKSINFVQEDGTIVAGSQPVSLSSGGVPLYNGSPIKITTTGDYSITVQDSSAAQVYYQASSTISSAIIFASNYGTGVTGLQAALDAAASGGFTLEIDQDYDIGSSRVELTGSNYVIKGNRSLITTTNERVFNVNGDIENITIRECRFESTGVSSGGVFGLFTVDNKGVDGLTISDNDFECSTVETNGIKLNNGSGNEISNVNITGNRFRNIGRIGIELNDQNFDGTFKIKNVNVSENQFYNLGVSSTSGFAVSFGGEIENSTISNNVAYQYLDIGYEIAGACRDITVTGNVARDPKANTTGFSMSAQTGQTNKQIDITGNTFYGNYVSPIYSTQNFNFTGNTVVISGSNGTLGYVNVRNCQTGLIGSNFVSSDGSYSILVEASGGNCDDVSIIGNHLDSRNAASNFSVVRFSGANCNNCTLDGNSLFRANGLWFDIAGGGANVITRNNTLDGDADLGHFQTVTIPNADTALVDFNMFADMLNILSSPASTGSHKLTVPSTFRGLITIRNNTVDTLTVGYAAGSVATLLTTEIKTIWLDLTNAFLVG